jgi:hypothetical protein
VFETEDFQTPPEGALVLRLNIWWDNDPEFS